MTTDPRQCKPRGFGLATRVVYVHQAVCFAFFVAGLRALPARGMEALVLPHLMGIAISVVILAAMFGVASRKSPKALAWLRVILWVSVAKILIVQLWLLAQGQTEFLSYIRIMLSNELIAIPVAVYWSRSVHSHYLASLRRSSPCLGE
jgi:hypothetical protein